MKHVRRHYGIALGDFFREGIDPEDYSYMDTLDNKKRCSHRMTWLISKASPQIGFKAIYISFG